MFKSQKAREHASEWWLERTEQENKSKKSSKYL